MRSSIAISALLFAGGVLAATQASAQLGFQTPRMAPEIRFDTPDPNYFELPPGNSAFGEVTGVGANAQGQTPKGTSSPWLAPTR